MKNNQNVGICKQCKNSMNIYQENCSRCGAKREDCFLSNEQQEKNLNKVRNKAWENLFSSFFENKK